MRGERLRKMRQIRGYTQEELAERADVGSRQIWRYENEETKPDSDVAARIAEALEVSADYLLGLDDDPTPKNHQNVNLSPHERRVIAALRRNEPLEAIKEIVGDD